MLRGLTILALTLAAGLSGYWFVGSRAVERGAVAGVEEARLAGWTIAYDDLSVAGFPNRFDTTVTRPRVTTPDGAVRWAAPFLQVFALAYGPRHLIVVAPDEMTVELPGDAVDIRSADLRGSFVVTDEAPPALDHSTVTTDTLRIALADLWVEIGAGQLSTRLIGAQNAHQVSLSLTDVTLAPALLAASGTLPDRIEAIGMDADLGLSEPVGPGRASRVETLLLRRAEAVWGDSRVALSGEMTVAADGTQDGAFTLALTRWRPLLDVLVERDLLTGAGAALLGAGIAGLADEDGVAQVPLTLTSGQVGVLGVPLLALPPLPGE